MSDGLMSRKAAFSLLQGVHARGKTLEQLEAKALKNLSLQDQKFALALTHATLKWDGALSSLVKKFVKPKLGQDEAVLIKMGLCQMLFMDGVAEHASIHETVELSRKVGAGRASKLINGVLRSAQRASLSPYNFSKAATVPAWLKKALKTHYGDAAMLVESALLDEPELYVRARTKDADTQGLQAVVGADGVYKVQKGMAPTSLAGWDDGAFAVQDVSAQLPALVLADMYKQESLSGAILDMCAAPGGKTVQLFDLLPDARHVACEMSPVRAERLKENMVRCGVHSDVLIADARDIKETYDAILLDAPCSATGTTRRHPDVLFTRSLESVKELSHLQESLLTHAVSILNKGGVLVYATCSLLKEENEDAVVRVLEKLKGQIELVPVARSAWPSAIKAPMAGTVRLSPSKGGDGFFVAGLKKLQ